MVGSAVHILLKEKKKFKIIDCKRKDLDFTSQKKLINGFKNTNQI